MGLFLANFAASLKPGVSVPYTTQDG